VDPSLYESVKLVYTTAPMENLQSQLKLKEGKVVQLQVRDTMGQELTKLTIKADQVGLLT
jgi:hypothetical protein